MRGTLALAGAALLVAAVLLVGWHGAGRVAEVSASRWDAARSVQLTARLDAHGRDEGATQAAGPRALTSEPRALPPLVRDLAPHERVRVLTVEQWRAVRDSGGPPVTMAMLMFCESGGDVSAVGSAGERGAFQVLERYWGPVPPTLAEQARQAATIMRDHGDAPWSTRGGCAIYSAPPGRPVQ